jgi:hypothetical protein
LRWEIVESPSGTDAFTWTHLRPDGSLGRTAPDRCVAGSRGTPRHYGALRPPYFHPDRQQLVHLPDPVRPSARTSA